MKIRVNLTIEDSLLKSVKLYAEKQGTSVSELTEKYFKSLAKPSKRKTIIDLVEEIGPHSIGPKSDLKELYYKEKSRA